MEHFLIDNTINMLNKTHIHCIVLGANVKAIPVAELVAMQLIDYADIR